MTSVKYGGDLKNLTCTFAKLKISLMEKLPNRALVTPTPDLVHTYNIDKDIWWTFIVVWSLITWNSIQQFSDDDKKYVWVNITSLKLKYHYGEIVKFLSLVSLKVVILAISLADIDENFVKMTFPFDNFWWSQWWKKFNQNDNISISVRCDFSAWDMRCLLCFGNIFLNMLQNKSSGADEANQIFVQCLITLCVWQPRKEHFGSFSSSHLLWCVEP